MWQRMIVLLLIMFFLTSFASAKEGKEEEGFKIGDPAPKFVLKDADDKEYSLELLLGKERSKAVILIMGDQKVRKEGNVWARELHKVYEKNENVVLIMIADLRGLAFFVTEDMVKWGTKRENLPIPILLDWGGKVSEQYKPQRGKPNIFIIGIDGKVSFHQVGKYSEDMMKKIQAKAQERHET